MMNKLGQLGDSGTSFIAGHNTAGSGGGYGYGRGASRPKRGLSLFLEGFPAQKWPEGQPIPYYFDSKIGYYN